MTDEIVIWVFLILYLIYDRIDRAQTSEVRNSIVMASACVWIPLLVVGIAWLLLSW